MQSEKNIPPLERFYTPKEVAEALKVKERVILDMLRKGQIRGVKVGKAWRIRESDLRAFVSTDTTGE